MTTLVVGASGATGRLLVEQLLNRGECVRIIVRTVDGLPETIKSHEDVSIIRASVLDLGDAELVQYVKGCNAVASCLGHNMSFKGILWSPSPACYRCCCSIVPGYQGKQARSTGKICAHEHHG
jgi:putative NADH-flavin reductase